VAQPLLPALYAAAASDPLIEIIPGITLALRRFSNFEFRISLR